MNAAVAMRPCPCCGQPMPAPVRVEQLDFLELTPQQRVILKVFLERYPRQVPKAVLINALWGLDPNGGPLSVDNGISVRVHQLNVRLRPYGWAIKGQGMGRKVPTNERRLVYIGGEL